MKHAISYLNNEMWRWSIAMHPLRLVLIFFTLMATFCASNAQSALVAYAYTGNNFNSISGTGITTSDFLSGTIIVDCGLLGGAGDCASLPFADYIPAITNFSFSSAGVTIDESTTFLVSGKFSTDDAGMIIDWNIVSNNTVPSFITISFPSCYTFFDSCDDFSTLDGDGIIFNDPGVWSTSAVPIPGALPLFISALIGLGFLTRGKLHVS
jgi:hypothetical protein